MDAAQTDIKQRLRTHYDGVWDEQPGTPVLVNAVERPADRYQACIKYVPRLFKSGSILELGAGTGHVARTLLASDLPIASYTVSDFSDVSLERLRKGLTDARVQVKRVDVEAIEEAELGRYDAILLVALIEHCVDPMAVMRRIRNLLKPGGFVYIDTPNIARYGKRMQLLLGRFPATASRNEGLTTYAGKPVDMHEEGHLHYFTFRSLSLMLTERCGFSSVTKLPYFGGRQVLPAPLSNGLARLWPEMFSELAVAAFA